MPATSPTLSPTLSAIVAGFRGSSSGMPCSTFPTRSAPTSAALVKIPPPTRANKACELAPIPKHNIVTVMVSSPSPTPHAKMAYQITMSSKARPTTVKPITAPLRNATFSPSLRLFCAPAAVRLLAHVAVFIPKNPANPENIPPVTNANGTNSLCTLSANAARHKNAKMTPKKTITTLYC